MPRPNRGPYLNFVRTRDRWYIQWSEFGRTRQKSTGFGLSDRAAANLALAEFIRQQHRGIQGGPRDPSQFSIDETLTLYGTEWAPRTADPVRIGYAIAALVPFWGNRMVADITPATCGAYERYRARAPGTVRRELGILNAAVKYAHKRGHITYGPEVELPLKPRGKERWLRRSEAAALLNAARTGHPSTRSYLPLFILIALYTGARKGAILSLRWPQVDLEYERINFNEPGAARTNKGRAHLPIPRRLVTFLRLARRYGTDLGYVLHRDGKKLGSIKRAFNAACDAAGLSDATPHTLRHTCGTWLAQQGVALDQIGAWLGHSDSRTTRLYAHHHPDYMQEARNAVDRRRA